MCLLRALPAPCRAEKIWRRHTICSHSPPQCLRALPARVCCIPTRTRRSGAGIPHSLHHWLPSLPAFVSPICAYVPTVRSGQPLVGCCGSVTACDAASFLTVRRIRPLDYAHGIGEWRLRWRRGRRRRHRRRRRQRCECMVPRGQRRPCCAAARRCAQRVLRSHARRRSAPLD